MTPPPPPPPHAAASCQHPESAHGDRALAACDGGLRTDRIWMTRSRVLVVAGPPNPLCPCPGLGAHHA